MDEMSLFWISLYLKVKQKNNFFRKYTCISIAPQKAKINEKLNTKKGLKTSTEKKK